MDATASSPRTRRDQRCGMFRSRSHAFGCLLWACAFGCWCWWGVVKFALMLMGW